MNFKSYVLMEAKKEEDMTPQELKASRAAKAEREKMLAKQRAALGLPPRSWQLAQQDPEEGPTSPWAKRIRRDVKAQEKKQPPSVPKFAALAVKRKKKKKEIQNEAFPSNKGGSKYVASQIGPGSDPHAAAKIEARKRAEGGDDWGTPIYPGGPLAHKKAKPLPKKKAKSLPKKKAKRLPKKKSGRDVRYSKDGKEYKVDVGMEGER